MSAVHKTQHLRTVMLEFQCSSLTWLLRAPKYTNNRGTKFTVRRGYCSCKTAYKSKPETLSEGGMFKKQEYKFKNIY